MKPKSIECLALTIAAPEFQWKSLQEILEAFSEQMKRQANELHNEKLLRARVESACFLLDGFCKMIEKELAQREAYKLPGVGESTTDPTTN